MEQPPRAGSIYPEMRLGSSASIAPQVSGSTTSPTFRPTHRSRPWLRRSRAAGIGEQMHQQMKDELGLDHFEGRSWRGLHHHALLCQLAFAFLQHLRLGGEKVQRKDRVRTAAPAEPTLPSAAASWQHSPASSCAAPTAGSASSIISGYRHGRVVLEERPEPGHGQRQRMAPPPWRSRAGPEAYVNTRKRTQPAWTGEHSASEAISAGVGVERSGR